ncbi:MAG: beta-glucosidase [Rhodospirillaceae bacterium]|nr:beta-glucosidase [Rhodospirillaceae bacterium]
MSYVSKSVAGAIFLAAGLTACDAGSPSKPAAPAVKDRPWMDTALSPEARAERLESEMTLDERIRMVHGVFAVPLLGPILPGALGSAGFVPGIERLGIPALQETDASVGVTNPFDVRKGDGATALPSSLMTAATWNKDLAYQGGAMIGQESWKKGFNVLLGGGVNLARDPRNGRTFEYLGEDPLLAGVMAGEAIRGTQDQHVISTIKHFALNAQETGRMILSAKIGEAAFRESDLLAFQIAIENGKPGSVMCAYNRVNTVYACGHDGLLNRTLKGDWGYPGWVMSDWGALHDVNYATAGLDQQSGEQLDSAVFFGEPLKKAVESGEIPAARLSDMVRRILRSMFAHGLFDNPPKQQEIDYDANAAVAQRVAEEGIVLLSNRGGMLPLARDAKRIVVIGGHADAGVLSGAGSSQVIPVGGAPVSIAMGGEGPGAAFVKMVFHASSPLKAIKAKAPNAEVRFIDDAYPSAAAALARDADVVVIFATQWMIEGRDVPDMTLPNGQDALIEAVAAVNPHTVVVLETGGPVQLPWLNKVGAVLAAWYPGARGGEAIANVLFGDVNPSGRLPMTFPASPAQLPRPEIDGYTLPPGEKFEVDYDVEGSDVGYRWFARKNVKPLFPFGFGLSYSAFAYANVTVTGGETLTVSFDVRNTGARAGADVPQVYLTDAAGIKRTRLLGWSKVTLEPGAVQRVTVMADPRLLADFDAGAPGWRLREGTYAVALGASAGDFTLRGEAAVSGRLLKP